MRTKKTIRIICFTVLVFLGGYLSIFQRLLNEIGSEFSFSRVLMGLLVSMHFAGLLTGPIIAGELSDRYGRRAVITSAFLFFITGLAVAAAIPAIPAVFFGIYSIGVGFGILEGTMSALITDTVEQKDVNHIMNISQIFFSVGAVTGPFIATAMADLSGKWQSVFLFSAVLVTAFLMIFRKEKFPDYKIEEKIQGAITIKLLKQSRFRLLCLSMIMYVGVEEGIAFWLSSYTMEQSTSKYSSGIILALFWGSMIFGKYLVSKFSSRLHELIIAGSVISSIFLIIAVFSPGFAVSSIAVFFVGFGLSGIWPMIMSIAKMMYPEYTGTAFGIMMACCAVGGMLVPLAMGYVGEVAGIRPAMASALIPMVVVIINHIKMRMNDNVTK